MNRAIVFAAVLAAAYPTAAAVILDGYAPPLTWGPIVRLPGHIGPVTYQITLKPIGSANVLGSVNFVDERGEAKSTEFFGTITFRTNGVGQPTLTMKSLGPTGTAVRIEVSP